VLDASDGRAVRPAVVFEIVERLMREGSARSSEAGASLSATDAAALLEAWLRSMGLELSAKELVGHFQGDTFDHRDLLRSARRIHERRLRDAVLRSDAADGEASFTAIAGEVLHACLPVVPYAPAAAFLGQEKAKLDGRDESPRRVALIAEGIGSMHGVTRTIEEIRERGVPGFEVEVVGTDGNVDRRLDSVAEVAVPFYRGLEVGIPSLPTVVETLAEGRYDLVHLCTPGPAGIAAGLTARVMGIPVVGSYHTELAGYAGLRTDDAALEAGVSAAVGAFYSACRAVLSPSPAADESLNTLGIPQERIGRWERGVDLDRFGPERRVAGRLPGALNVLYAGRLTTEKGIDLLADAFTEARRHDERLHLVLAGGGPEEHTLRKRLGRHATFLGWLGRDELATVYASADVFLSPSQTDTFGQVILEAQASGLPIIAVAQGGPTELLIDGRTGVLCPPDPRQLGAATARIAASPRLGLRLADAARRSVRERTWARALNQLADGYVAALEEPATMIERAA